MHNITTICCRASKAPSPCMFLYSVTCMFICLHFYSLRYKVEVISNYHLLVQGSIITLIIKRTVIKNLFTTTKSVHSLSPLIHKHTRTHTHIYKCICMLLAYLFCRIFFFSFLGTLTPFSAKPIFDGKKKIFFRKFCSYSSFYAREKKFKQFFFIFFI